MYRMHAAEFAAHLDEEEEAGTDGHTRGKAGLQGLPTLLQAPRQEDHQVIQQVLYCSVLQQAVVFTSLD